MAEMRKKFADAQAELTSATNALADAEPATERTAFLDWVREVCKNASDDQFTEFQTNVIQMQAKWKQQQRSAQMSPARECGGFQSKSGTDTIRSHIVSSITKYINWQQFTKGTRGRKNEQLFPRQVAIQLPKRN